MRHDKNNTPFGMTEVARANIRFGVVRYRTPKS